MKKEKTPNTNKRQQLPPIARWLQAGLAFVLAYILLTWAIDSGSLLEYALAILFVGLGVRHTIQAVRPLRSKQ